MREVRLRAKPLHRPPHRPRVRMREEGHLEEPEPGSAAIVARRFEHVVRRPAQHPVEHVGIERRAAPVEALRGDGLDRRRRERGLIDAFDTAERNQRLLMREPRPRAREDVPVRTSVRRQLVADASRDRGGQRGVLAHRPHNAIVTAL
jgi:hypothetical protein